MSDPPKYDFSGLVKPPPAEMTFDVHNADGTVKKQTFKNAAPMPVIESPVVSHRLDQQTYEQRAPEQKNLGQPNAYDFTGLVKKPPASSNDSEPLGIRDTVLNFFRPLSPEERQGIDAKLGNVAGPIVEGVGNAAMGVAQGFGGMLLHPINAIYGSAQTASDALNQMFPDVGLNPKQKAAKDASLARLKDQWEQIKDNPDFSLGALVGGIEAGNAVGEAVPKVVGAATKALKDKTQSIRTQALQGLTGTGPQVAEQLANKTRTANATAVDKYNAKVEPIRETAATMDQLNTAEKGYKVDLKKTYEETKAEANRRYNSINEQMAGSEADPDFLPDALQSASEKIRGSETVPPILKDMELKIKRGDGLSYSDLQGYRSELGSALQRGLPDDVYYAYKTLQEDVSNEMVRLAEEKSPELGQQLTDARDYYRRYAKTFLDRLSPVAKVLRDPEEHGLLKKIRDKDISGVEAIRQFNPSLADKIQGSLGQMEDISAPRGRSPLRPPQEPTPPVTEVVTPESLSDFKESKAIDRAERIRNSSNHLATVFVALDAFRRLFHGDIAGMGLDIGARVGYAVGKNSFASALRDPKVIEAVRKITPADAAEIMKLPPEQRMGFDTFLQTSDAMGIKINPAVLKAAGITVGATSSPAPKTEYLKQLRDSYQITGDTAQ